MCGYCEIHLHSFAIPSTLAEMAVIPTLRSHHRLPGQLPSMLLGLVLDSSTDRLRIGIDIGLSREADKQYHGKRYKNTSRALGLILASTSRNQQLQPIDISRQHTFGTMSDQKIPTASELDIPSEKSLQDSTSSSLTDLGLSGKDQGAVFGNEGALVKHFEPIPEYVSITSCAFTDISNMFNRKEDIDMIPRPNGQKRRRKLLSER